MAEHPNAARIRRGFAAFNVGDIDTLSELITEDAVQGMPGDHQLSGDHKGRQAIFEMYMRLAQVTDGTFRADLEAVYADDHVAVAIYRATGRRNGRALDQRSALIFEMIDGRATRLTDVPQDIDEVNAFLAP